MTLGWYSFSTLLRLCELHFILRCNVSSCTEARKHCTKSGTLVFDVNGYLPFIAGSLIPLFWPCGEVCAALQWVPGAKGLFPFKVKPWHKWEEFFHAPVFIGSRNILYSSVIFPLPFSMEFSCSFCKKSSHLSRTCQQHLTKADSNYWADPVLCFGTQSKHFLYAKKQSSV